MLEGKVLANGEIKTDESSIEALNKKRDNLIWEEKMHKSK